METLRDKYKKEDVGALNDLKAKYKTLSATNASIQKNYDYIIPILWRYREIANVWLSLYMLHNKDAHAVEISQIQPSFPEGSEERKQEEALLSKVIILEKINQEMKGKAKIKVKQDLGWDN